MKIIHKSWQTQVAAGESIYIIKGLFKKHYYQLENGVLKEVKHETSK